MTQTEIPDPDTKTALLVDGENIGVADAGRILLLAGKNGWPNVRRVYGNAARIPGWAAAPGFRFVQTSTHKNAADMALCVDAMDLFHSGVTTIFIASSDSDFSYLALTLREKGASVVGIGESKTSEAFRKACSTFFELAQRPAPPEKPPETVEAKIAAVLEARGGEMEITALSVAMKQSHAVLISTLPDKTWRAYLTKRPTMFACEPKGPAARVRLMTGVG